VIGGGQAARAEALVRDFGAAFARASEAIRAVDDPRERFRLATELGAVAREQAAAAADFRAAVVMGIRDDEHLSLASLAARLELSKGRVDQIIRAARAKRNDTEEPVTEPADKPEPVPVVAAIVTCHLGVLIGRRNDGKPPWTFIAGEIEPGESPADAAVREVKEETGLLIKAGDVIGRRVHPKTGRTMVYMAAEPTHGTEVFVGDEDELAEVRWASLAEADELLPGMYEPVRAHLGKVLPRG
jgi:8-oxo-dGTP pyrophosphatase MutT (NUDIX family)